MSTFSIDYLVRRSPIGPERIGARAFLVCEARAFNPPTDKYSRADTRYTGNFESTILDEWEECTITVQGILHGQRNELILNDLSRHDDFKQFYQSAGDGQQMALSALDIGGIDAEFDVKLISTSNELVRVKTKQKFRTTFRLQKVV